MCKMMCAKLCSKLAQLAWVFLFDGLAGTRLHPVIVDREAESP